MPQTVFSSGLWRTLELSAITNRPEKKPSSPTHESSKHKEDAGEHPGLYCCQTLSLGCVGGDVIEDVDQDQEQGDEERHPPRDYVHGDEK